MDSENIINIVRVEVEKPPEEIPESPQTPKQKKEKRRRDIMDLIQLDAEPGIRDASTCKPTAATTAQSKAKQLPST